MGGGDALVTPTAAAPSVAGPIPSGETDAAPADGAPAEAAPAEAAPADGAPADGAPAVAGPVVAEWPPDQGPEEGRAPGRRQGPPPPPVARGRLVPAPDLTGPKVSLGLGWAVVTGAALLGGSVILGAWFAAVAALASVQAARSWKRAPSGRRPVPQAAAAASALVVAGAGLGIVAGVAALVLAVVGATIWAALVAIGRDGDEAAVGDVVLTLACAAVPAAALVGPVLLRGHGLAASLVLLVYAMVYDASAWLVGSGTRRRWDGPVAGMASIASVTVAVAAVFPQFKGSSPWVLGALAAVLAPLGPAVATLVLGNRRARVPALRRIDSLIVLGPLWAIAAAVIAT